MYSVSSGKTPPPYTDHNPQNNFFFFLIKCNTVKRLDNHKEIKMHKLPPQHCNQIFHSKLSLLMIKTELGKSTICRFNGSVAC